MFNKSIDPDDFAKKYAIFANILNDPKANLSFTQSYEGETCSLTIASGHIDKARSTKVETYQNIIVTIKLARKPVPYAKTDNGKDLALAKAAPEMDVLSLTLWKHGSRPKLMYKAISNKLKGYFASPVTKKVTKIKTIRFECPSQLRGNWEKLCEKVCKEANDAIERGEYFECHLKGKE